MKTFRIAVYPGDGIGPEVIDQALRVLQDVADRCSFTVQTTRFDWGADHHATHGIVAPADYLELLRPFDAILLGALGMPSPLPDHVTREPLVRLRQTFDQYACVRPARTFAGVKPVLAAPGDI